MKIVLIEWEDSYCTSAWSEDIDVCRCVSAGIFIKEDDGKVVIASALSGEMFNGALAIPKGCIKSIREVYHS